MHGFLKKAERVADWISLRLAELTYLRGIEEAVFHPIRGLCFLATKSDNQQARRGAKKRSADRLLPSGRKGSQFAKTVHNKREFHGHGFFESQLTGDAHKLPADAPRSERTYAPIHYLI
ncbi:hypothetical protein RAS2_09540 [Phycisphaerae bacterium RAS2]|nr:hypothetical protein RAS2_09540 [Phycisphaerae bacterium RAS2]